MLVTVVAKRIHPLFFTSTYKGCFSHHIITIKGAKHATVWAVKFVLDLFLTVDPAWLAWDLFPKSHC